VKKVFIISLILASMLAGIAYFAILSPIFSAENDIKNTNMILVTETESGESWKITDQSLIDDIVKQLMKKEKENTYDTAAWSVTYSLELFSEQYGYGPLDCYEEQRVCIYQSATDTFLNVSEGFFELVRSSRP